MKVRAVTALEAEHRPDLLPSAAGLARSTFSYHQARPAAPDPQARPKTAIGEVFTAAKGRYGHRRVQVELAETGRRVTKRTVLEPMRRLGPVCRIRRRQRYNSYHKALATLLPVRASLMHTDQGFRYQHDSWRRLLAAADATRSMSPKATAWTTP